MNPNEVEIHLSAEDRSVCATVHEFAEEVLRPAGHELDRLANPADVIARESVLWSVIDAYKELGVAHLYQDQTMDSVSRARLIAAVNEELAWGDVGLAISTGLCSFHTPWIQQTGDSELIARFCKTDDLTIGCWALTEPDHGSDTVMPGESHFLDPAHRPNCVARKDGSFYVISGQKAAWVSNGSIADVAVLFCAVSHDRGLAGGGVFCVPLDLPGVERGRPLDKLGQRSLNQGELFFHEVRVPASYMAVGPDLYPLALESMLGYANAGMAQLFVGLARAALEHAVTYAKDRVQGGRAIFEHQAVKSRLFKMFMRVEAARALARRVAVYNGDHMPIVQLSIAAKVFCTGTAFEVASDAVQMFGGNGLSREYPVEKLLRDARASMIEDGCNEVLGLVAAAKL